MTLAEQSHSGLEFFLKMNVDELSEWVEEYNEHLREKAAAMKKAQR